MLLSALLGQDNPMAKWAGGNNNFLTSLGAGIASGPDLASGIGAGLRAAPQAKMLDMQVAQQQAEKAKEEQQANATKLFLQEKAPDLAQMLDTGIPMNEVWGEYMRRQSPDGGGNENFFGNLVPMQDENGNVVLGQASNKGRWQPLQGAEGFRPAPTTKQIDTGTEIITQDIYGNEMYRTPKQNERAAFDTQTGAGLGRTNAENIASAESLASKMPGLQTVVNDLDQLAQTATYTMAGQAWDEVVKQVGGEPSEAAVARAKYIAMVDNQVLPLLRDTFGAAFTQKEGESLRATLGDPNKHPAEKKAVLEAFISQKMRDVQGMQSRIPGGTQTSTGVTWSIEP